MMALGVAPAGMQYIARCVGGQTVATPVHLVVVPYAAGAAGPVPSSSSSSPGRGAGAGGVHSGAAAPPSLLPLDLTGVSSWWHDALLRDDAAAHQALAQDAAARERLARRVVAEELSVESSDDDRDAAAAAAAAELAALEARARKGQPVTPRQPWYPSGNTRQRLHPKYSALQDAIRATHDEAAALRDLTAERAAAMRHQRAEMELIGGGGAGAAGAIEYRDSPRRTSQRTSPRLAIEQRR
jgi:hypothetical protein